MKGKRLCLETEVMLGEKGGEKGGAKGAMSQEPYKLGAFGARNVRTHV